MDTPEDGNNDKAITEDEEEEETAHPALMYLAVKYSMQHIPNFRTA